MICRIFHKSGEKRGAQHLDASSSPPTKSYFSTPPPSSLLASPITSFTMEQQQQQHREQNDHLSHSHNNLFPSLHTFQLPSFPNIAAASATTLKAKEEQTVPKTEATFYDQYQQSLLNPLNPISNFVQNSISLFPLDQNMDAVGLMPFSGAANINNADQESVTSSTTAPFNRVSSSLQQMVNMVDAPIGIDSWPLQAQLA